MPNMRRDWSIQEVEATVADYLQMLAAELAGVPYSKAAHRKRLVPRLDGRSEASVEFKHANISAALIELGFPFLSGYKPRWNYQAVLLEEVSRQLSRSPQLLEIAAANAEQPMVVPEVDDILSVLTDRPSRTGMGSHIAEPGSTSLAFASNFLEREARNRSLGTAGELFVLNFERARLIHAGKESLAARIEHTARVRGDGEGFDVLSFEPSGLERLIEVKTTKYGRDTPFFLSRNEVDVSASRADTYHLYRLFEFGSAPGLFILQGQLSTTCVLSASAYRATVA
jgi:hypothetical protein